MNLDHSILTIITFVPLAGAIVLALLPDRDRIQQWSALAVTLITFLLTRALPGDPAAYFAGPAATKEAIEQVRIKLGLDKPLIVQFGQYISDLGHLNLGTSLTTGQPVLTELENRLPASAELTLFGLILSMAIAIPLGILAAVKRARREPAQDD